MRRSATLLVVSPHPDDAAISLGGAILKYSTVATTVWNVFTRQCYSLIDGDAEAAQARILQEELAAAEALGARAVMAGFPEAELRGYTRLSERLGHQERGILARPGERELIEELMSAFRGLLEALRPTFVGVPLGVGGHIDHLLCRQAVVASFAGASTRSRLFFYEDLPYALHGAWQPAPIAELGRRGLHLVERLLPVGAFLERKARVLEGYRSQLRERDIRRLTAYTAAVGANGGAERVWLPYAGKPGTPASCCTPSEFRTIDARLY